MIKVENTYVLANFESKVRILRISEEMIEKIKEENDIVDIISEHVRLKRTGRNYSGLCPFHHEKTPSFSVSQDKQIYKCFGCGEAGNVITFLMKLRNLSFIEACEFLAERAKIDLHINENNNSKNTSKKLYDINTEAARFYFNNLKNNVRIIKYLNDRGLSGKIIANFGLGYALDSWNSLYDYLKGKGFSELDMLSLGLISKSKHGNYYDRFRNRVIFPVFNVKGKVIGFGGRVLDDSKPKYLNSPETILFNKGTNLYGLNFAVKNNTTKSFIMVEGYMDCISLHQVGITNAIASLGTALTVNQAKLIKKYTNKVYISYDSDLAGQNAANRGLDILTSEGLEVKVVDIENGKDPDEFIKKYGKDAFLKLLEKALPLEQYKINKARKETNLKDEKSLNNFINKISDILISLSPVERNLYVKKISEEVNVDENVIYDVLNEKNTKNKKNENKVNRKGKYSLKLYREEPSMKAGRALINLLINKRGFQYIINELKTENILNKVHKKIFDLIIENMELDSETLRKKLELLCQDIDMSKEFVNINEVKLISLEEDEEIKVYVKDCIKELKKSRLEESKKEIMNNIKCLEKQGMLEESIKFAQDLVEIEKRIREIQ